MKVKLFMFTGGKRRHTRFNQAHDIMRRNDENYTIYQLETATKRSFGFDRSNIFFLVYVRGFLTPSRLFIIDERSRQWCRLLAVTLTWARYSVVGDLMISPFTGKLPLATTALRLIVTWILWLRFCVFQRIMSLILSLDCGKNQSLDWWQWTFD